MRILLQTLGAVTLALSLVAVGVLLAPLVRPKPQPVQTLVDWPQPCPQECGGGSDLFQLRRK